jgi:hypothetical protein
MMPPSDRGGKSRFTGSGVGTPDREDQSVLRLAFMAAVDLGDHVTTDGSSRV